MEQFVSINYFLSGPGGQMYKTITTVTTAINAHQIGLIKAIFLVKIYCSTAFFLDLEANKENSTESVCCLATNLHLISTKLLPEKLLCNHTKLKEKFFVVWFTPITKEKTISEFSFSTMKALAFVVVILCLHSVYCLPSQSIPDEVL
jgi:hypothetical protein